MFRGVSSNKETRFIGKNSHFDFLFKRKLISLKRGRKPLTAEQKAENKLNRESAINIF